MSTNLYEIIIGGLIVTAVTVIISSIRRYMNRQEQMFEKQNETNNGFLSALQDLARQMEVAIAKINERDSNQKELCSIHNKETCDIKRGLNVAVSKLNIKIDNNDRRITILEEHRK